MRVDEKGVTGAQELLCSLPLQTLLTLCHTVTENMIKADSQEEAVKAIILHSHDLDSILRRKAMTRDVLFQYLHQKGVSVTPSTVKQELITKTLSFWLSNEQQVQLAIQQNTTVQVNTDSQLQMMGQQFTSWFYSLLTRCGLSADNFWENSEVLFVLTSSHGENQSTLFNGVAQVLNAFTQLIQGYGFVLAPNPMGGCSAEMDHHGLVLISCSGTVYKQSNCTGVFQQTFALTADPFSQGYWRIKRSKLEVRLETQSVSWQGMPAIQGCNAIDRA